MLTKFIWYTEPRHSEKHCVQINEYNWRLVEPKINHTNKFIQHSLSRSSDFFVLLLRNFTSKHRRGLCTTHLLHHHLHFHAMILIRLIEFVQFQVVTFVFLCIILYCQSYSMFLYNLYWTTLVLKFLKLQFLMHNYDCATFFFFCFNFLLQDIYD